MLPMFHYQYDCLDRSSWTPQSCQKRSLQVWSCSTKIKIKEALVFEIQCFPYNFKYIYQQLFFSFNLKSLYFKFLVYLRNECSCDDRNQNPICFQDSTKFFQEIYFAKVSKQDWWDNQNSKVHWKKKQLCF